MSILRPYNGFLMKYAYMCLWQISIYLSANIAILEEEAIEDLAGNKECR